MKYLNDVDGRNFTCKFREFCYMGNIDKKIIATHNHRSKNAIHDDEDLIKNATHDDEDLIKNATRDVEDLIKNAFRDVETTFIGIKRAGESLDAARLIFDMVDNVVCEIIHELYDPNDHVSNMYSKNIVNVYNIALDVIHGYANKINTALDVCENAADANDNAIEIYNNLKQG